MNRTDEIFIASLCDFEKVMSAAATVLAASVKFEGAVGKDRDLGDALRDRANASKIASLLMRATLGELRSYASLEASEAQEDT